MRFKKNITVTVACVITECLISLIPVILMIYIFFMADKISEIFSTLFIIPYFILIINVILFIISLIARIFIKTEYCVNDECLLIKTESNEKQLKYGEISSITYDMGDLTKFNTQPSQLVLFDKESKQLLSVSNPSIIMTHMIKKNCKNIKISYYHNKRFLYLLLLINGTVLLISVLAKLFS